MKTDKDFKALLEFKWSHARLNENKAVRILKRFMELERVDMGADTKRYKITSHNPLETQEKLFEQERREAHKDSGYQTTQNFNNAYIHQTFVSGISDQYDNDPFGVDVAVNG